MKLITINPNNEPYYSEDFIKGFKCGAQRQLEADKADRPQEWVDKAISIIDEMEIEGIIAYEQACEYRMRARMKGTDDE